jgi:hypothetical protein
MDVHLHISTVVIYGNVYNVDFKVQLRDLMIPLLALFTMMINCGSFSEICLGLSGPRGVI